MNQAVNWRSGTLAAESLPPAVVHVDLDGARDIYAAHGWDYPYSDDPVFETGLENLLALFDEFGIRGTLFVIAGHLESRCRRGLLEQAVRRGHEIASHTLTHANLRRLDGRQKQREIAESRGRLEDALGVPVGGFRAPGYQIDYESLTLLGRHGYLYDSSAFPTRTYARWLGTSADSLGSPCRPVPDSTLVELPLPDHRPSPLPFNPSYAMLLGMRYFRWGLNRARRRGQPLVLLFHLIDASRPLAQERLKGRKSRLFTLSNVCGERKLACCREILGVVARHYRFTTTRELLHEVNMMLENSSDVIKCS